jgi:hypothetical protein
MNSCTMFLSLGAPDASGPSPIDFSAAFDLPRKRRDKKRAIPALMSEESICAPFDSVRAECLRRNH